MDDLYIYIDETSKEGFYGVCAIITENEIKQQLIDEALLDLQSAKNLSDWDRKTITTGHFHANKDSHAAILSLAKSIGRNLTAVVLYSYRKKSPDSTTEDEYRLHTVTNIIEAMEIPTRLNICFEERNKFKMTHARRLEERLFLFLEKQVLRLPLYTCFRPKISWTSAGKRNPGTQVADLILWSINNSVLEKPSNRFNAAELFGCMKLGTFMSAVIKPQDPDSISEESHGRTGRYLINRRNPYFASQPSPYPTHVNFTLSTEDCFQLFNLAETTIHYFASRPLPVTAEHLGNEIRSISNKCKENSFIDLDDIAGLASVFIQMFDIIPVYDQLPMESPQFHQLLRARFMLAKILHEAAPVPIRMKNFIARRRHAAATTTDQ